MAQTAGAFNVGRSYTIVSVGTTDFTLIGASANTVGVVFTASGVGAGTGTATPNAVNSNTAIGSNTGRGIITGTNNTIVGASVTGLNANLSGAVILATGDGVIQADYNKSVTGAWTLAKPLKTPTYTVATLPAASLGAGMRAFVSDSTVATFGLIVVGSGSTFVPVYSDGTNWRIG